MLRPDTFFKYIVVTLYGIKLEILWWKAQLFITVKIKSLQFHTCCKTIAWWLNQQSIFKINYLIPKWKLLFSKL